MSCLLAFVILKQGEEMPRYARKRSLTGIYHVMLKGIDGRDIFLDDEDKGKFIENTLKARENRIEDKGTADCVKTRSIKR